MYGARGHSSDEQCDFICREHNYNRSRLKQKLTDVAKHIEQTYNHQTKKWEDTGRKDRHWWMYETGPFCGDPDISGHSSSSVESCTASPPGFPFLGFS